MREGFYSILLAFLCVSTAFSATWDYPNGRSTEHGDTVFIGEDWFIKPDPSNANQDNPKTLEFVPVDAIPDTNFYWNQEVKVTGDINNVENPELAAAGENVSVVWFRQFGVTNVFANHSASFGFDFEDTVMLSQWAYPPSLSPRIDCADTMVFVVWNDACCADPRGVYLRKSFDGGQTWESEDTVAYYQYYERYANRPDIIYNHAILYCTYECDDNMGHNQRFKRSLDRGETWISESVVGTIASGRGAELAMGDDVLHVIRQSGIEVVYNRSLDYGATWEADRTISESDGEGSQWPTVAADPYGNVYACWYDYKELPPGGQGWIFYRKSSDHGETWGEIKSLSTSPMAGNPSLYADSQGVYVVYQDRSRDFGNIDILFRKSRDFGESWTPEVMLDSTANSTFYPRIVTEHGKYHVVYNGLWDQSYERAWYKKGGFYVPGDANDDGLVNISDAVQLVQYIFASAIPPILWKAGDANCDGIVNITDAVYLITYIFAGGDKPCSSS